MIHDVIIIGAGPCGLAVAARLRENTPSALFTDAEHARYWRRHTRTQTLESESRNARRRARQQRSNDTVNSADSSEVAVEQQSPTPSLLVLDSGSDEWLHTWRSRFEALKISHLRSPLFFHCDPRDRDGLLEYGHAQGRSDELEEINNVIGREVSKHQKKKNRIKKSKQSTRHLHLDNRDQIDYYTPSSALFRDYCQSLAHRYGLKDVIQKATVKSIKYDRPEILTEGEAIFTVTTSNDQIFLARVVVVAVGAGTTPSIPAGLKFLHQGSASHAFSSQSLLPLSVLSTVPGDRSLIVAVIGGGLTSAQIVLLLLQHNRVGKVYLILRSKLKIKHFDVDLEWVSKLRNANMAAFWSADSDEERFEMMKAARNGGSMPPKWAKVMRNLEKQGKVECLESTCIADGSWDGEAKTWDLRVESEARSCTRVDSSDNEKSAAKARRSLSGIDHVICATGMAPDIHNVDFLGGLRNEYPIESIGGLARLNDDLKWNADVPLFLTGALAGLRLGPGAGNLAGARLGAERVAWGIENFLHTHHISKGIKGSFQARKSSEVDSAYWSATSSDRDTMSEVDDSGSTRRYSIVDRSEFTGGFSNQFEALAM